MLYFKSRHDGGLDYFIFSTIQNKTITLKKNYYLYTFDYCYPNCAFMPDAFYDNNINKSNCWNYDLDYNSTRKDNIMINSYSFGFGNINYTVDDTNILVKGIGHHIIDTVKDTYEAHIQNKIVFQNDYNKKYFIGQKILYTNSNINEELNIFVIRNLNTRKLNFYCVMNYNNYNININRKFNKTNNKPQKVDISILEDKQQNFIDYLNYINFDFGRIELIKDYKLGWCILDINNSSGGGYRKDYNESFKEDICKLFLEQLE